MRKTLLASAVAGALFSPLSHADVYDARAMARGGTGMTLGEYNQAIYNPALINRFDDNDDFSFALNGGLIASDKDGFIDAADEFSDLIDELEDSSGPVPQGTIDAAKLGLQNMSDKLVQIDAGGAVMIGIPAKRLPMAFVAKGKAAIGTAFVLDSRDINPDPYNNNNPDGTIGEIANDSATADDLLSEVAASLLWTAEYGLMLGKGFDLGGLRIDGGAVLKAQTIELIAYQDNAANFEADDITDSDNLTSHTNVNVDLGATTRLGSDGRFVLAGTIENLIPKSFDGPNGSEYDMAPVLTAGAGYDGSWFKAEASLDLTQRNGYDLLLDTQLARLGIEFSAGRHLHLRAGYRTDLKSNVSDLMTAGLGITPWDRFNIDISGGVGEGETYAAALQLGFKI